MVWHSGPFHKPKMFVVHNCKLFDSQPFLDRLQEGFYFEAHGALVRILENLAGLESLQELCYVFVQLHPDVSRNHIDTPRQLD
jgi:hypothetical protein